MSAAGGSLSSDEQKLAELGYKQELQPRLERVLQLRDLAHHHLHPQRLLHDLRAGVERWRSDRDLDRLAGDQLPRPARRRCRWPNWPPKYPTAGGIYYWAYQLGGVRWAWFTGWFNLLGLVAIIAAVDYGAAAFLNSVLGALRRPLHPQLHDDEPLDRPAHTRSSCSR